MTGTHPCNGGSGSGDRRIGIGLNSNWEITRGMRMCVTELHVQNPYRPPDLPSSAPTDVGIWNVRNQSGWSYFPPTLHSYIGAVVSTKTRVSEDRVRDHCTHIRQVAKASLRAVVDVSDLAIRKSMFVQKGCGVHAVNLELGWGSCTGGRSLVAILV